VTVAPKPDPTDAASAMAADFELARPRLLGLAYRMLGIVADAEDVVQEAWIRFQAAGGQVEQPAAWLTTVASRLAIDRLRANARRREEYVGPWLPEPVVLIPGPEEAAELADSLTLGFLTMLDRLKPAERAVFLLADVFGLSYLDIAATVGKSEVSCRQIASRARRRVTLPQPGSGRASPEQQQVVDELVQAVLSGDIEGALSRLAPDAVLVSDAGAHRRAARRPVIGATRVARFLVNLVRRYSTDVAVVATQVNGDPGFLVSLAGSPDTVIAFDVQAGRVATIWMVRNPDKLDHLGGPVAMY
jgi:RNA polymerase sigma-70 factor (ECF subfamily)